MIFVYWDNFVDIIVLFISLFVSGWYPENPMQSDWLREGAEFSCVLNTVTGICDESAARRNNEFFLLK